MKKAPKKRPGQIGGVRDKNREEKRQTLVSAGIRVFLAKGVDGATIDDIIREAGVAKGSYYRYFESKVALLEAATLPVGARTAALLDSTLREISPDGVGEDLVATIAYQKLGLQMGLLLNQNEDLFRLYLQESRGAETQARAPLVALSDMICSGAIAISTRAEKLGIQKTSSPVVSALIVVGAAELFAHRFLTNREIGGNPATMVTSIVETILNGIRPIR